VVITKSIPFSIENQNINLEQLIRLRKLKQNEAKTEQNALSSSALNLLDDQEIALDDDHLDLFEELNAILGESDKI
jgi:DNA-damage-inducible protein J